MDEARQAFIEWQATDEYRQWFDETLDIQDNRCYYCKVQLTMRTNVDHAIPISAGGTNDPHNLVIACWHCNKTKGSSIVELWRCPNIEQVGPRTLLFNEGEFVRFRYVYEGQVERELFLPREAVVPTVRAFFRWFDEDLPG